jgi:hypothetical protein
VELAGEGSSVIGAVGEDMVEAISGLVGVIGVSCDKLEMGRSMRNWHLL